MPQETRSDQMQSAIACLALGALGVALGLCTGRGLLDFLGFTAKTGSRAGVRASLVGTVFTLVCLGAGIALLIAGLRSLANASKKRKAEEDDPTLPPSMSNRYR